MSSVAGGAITSPKSQTDTNRPTVTERSSSTEQRRRSLSKLLDRSIESTMMEMDWRRSDDFRVEALLILRGYLFHRGCSLFNLKKINQRKRQWEIYMEMRLLMTGNQTVCGSFFFFSLDFCSELHFLSKPHMDSLELIDFMGAISSTKTHNSHFRTWEILLCRRATTFPF